MNIIEKLGGYERAKAFLNAVSYTMDELIMMQRTGLRPQHVEKALLDYRRQHNIFETGDLIFDLSDDDEKYTGQILEVSEIGLDFLVCYDNQGKRFCVITDDAIHATPEEIQAGKRLP